VPLTAVAMFAETEEVELVATMVELSGKSLKLLRLDKSLLEPLLLPPPQATINVEMKNIKNKPLGMNLFIHEF